MTCAFELDISNPGSKEIQGVRVRSQRECGSWRKLLLLPHTSLSVLVQVSRGKLVERRVCDVEGSEQPPRTLCDYPLHVFDRKYKTNLPLFPPV